MDFASFLLVIAATFCWGLWSFLSKISTSKIGEKNIFWQVISYFLLVIGYSLLIIKNKDGFNCNKTGIIIALLAGVINALGGIFFYILLSKKNASLVVPFTSLFPVVTVFLAVIFLHENVSFIKAVGIVLAVAAVYLLSL